MLPWVSRKLSGKKPKRITVTWLLCKHDDNISNSTLVPKNSISIPVTGKCPVPTIWSIETELLCRVKRQFLFECALFAVVLIGKPRKPKHLNESPIGELSTPIEMAIKAFGGGSFQLGSRVG